MCGKGGGHSASCCCTRSSGMCRLPQQSSLIMTLAGRQPEKHSRRSIISRRRMPTQTGRLSRGLWRLRLRLGTASLSTQAWTRRIGANGLMRCVSKAYLFWQLLLAIAHVQGKLNGAERDACCSGTLQACFACKAGYCLLLSTLEVCTSGTPVVLQKCSAHIRSACRGMACLLRVQLCYLCGRLCSWMSIWQRCLNGRRF